MISSRIRVRPDRPRGALMEHKKLFESIEKEETLARALSKEEIRKMFDTQPAEKDDDTVLLDWFGDGYIITYGTSLSNPDWDFLNTWYDDEVQALCDMNAQSPLAPSLQAYLLSRQAQ